MDFAAGFADRVDVQSDDFEIRIKPVKGFGCFGVSVPLTELGADDGAVADVEIDIRANDVVLTDPGAGRGRDLHDFQRLARGVCRPARNGQGFRADWENGSLSSA
jgi:hypothetical protein